MGSANAKLNLLKGFACMGVVFIHVVFPGIFGQIVQTASAYAVPVFFMIAGYYSFGRDKNTIRHRLKKIVCIFIIAWLIFFFYGMAGAVIGGEGLSAWLHRNFNWKTPVKMIFFCTVDLAIPLWYLIAMIEVYLVWYFVVKHGKEEAIVRFFPVLFVLQVLTVTFFTTMDYEWFWRINFITRAMPWFLLGYHIKTREAEIVRRFDARKLILPVAVGCLITVIPVALDLPFRFESTGYIPYAYGLFCLALKDPDKGLCRPVEYIGEKLSLYVYILHVPLSGAMDDAAAYLFGVDTAGGVYRWCRPLLVLPATLGVAFLICQIARGRERFWASPKS